MSLYSEYLCERTEDKIIERYFGFVTYRHLFDSKSTYIVDIYVVPKLRKKGLAKGLADEVIREAKTLGHTKIIGTVQTSLKSSTKSLKVLLEYGMKLQSSGVDYLILEKEI